MNFEDEADLSTYKNRLKDINKSDFAKQRAKEMIEKIENKYKNETDFIINKEK